MNWKRFVIFSCYTLCIWLQYKLAMLLGGNYPQQMRLGFIPSEEVRTHTFRLRNGRLTVLILFGLSHIAALVWLFNPFGKLESLMGFLLNSGSAKLKVTKVATLLY